MTKKKTTKRSLMLSALSLLVCVSMLIGSTFAWFTDNVTSGINKIVAGNLDVEVYYGKEAEPTTNKVAGAENIFTGVNGEEVLWEPGAVAYTNLNVVNEGSLALQYQFAVNFENENYIKGTNAKLSEVLKVAFLDAPVTGTREEILAAAKDSGVLLSNLMKTGFLEKEANKVYGAVIYWEPSEDDNNWNVNNDKTTSDGMPLHIDLGLKLIATQLTNEHDSFGNDYDAMAGGSLYNIYTFSNPADLLAFAPTPGNAASSGLSIQNGKAQIDAKGAWYGFDANLAEKEYMLQYEMDITGLAEGESLTVDTGDGNTWGSTPITMERGSAKIYYGTAKNEYIGTLEGTKLTLTHTYVLKDGKLEITTVISDGVASLTCTKAVNSSAQTKLYWDIFTVSQAGKATLDNFTLRDADAIVDSAEELNAAIAAVEDGGTIVLAGDITFKTGANGTTNGISYTGAASFTLDLNGKTVTSDLGGNALRFKIGDGNDVTNTEVTITIKNGKVVSGPNNWCAISAATADNSGNKLTLNLENMEVEASKAGDFAVKAWSGAVINAKDVTATTSYAGGFYAVGGEMVLDNCTAIQTGLHTSPYLSMAFAVSNNGKMTVNSGNYTTTPAAASDANNQGTSHGSWVGGVMSSGGTLIINGGTFANGNFGEDSLATAARGLIMADTGAVVEIYDGTFNAVKTVIDIQNNLGDASKNPTVTLYGGTFSADPTVSNEHNLIKVADGFKVIENEDGTWSVAIPKASTDAEFSDAITNGGTVQIDGKFTVEDFNSGVRGETTLIGGTLSRDSGNGNPLTVYTTEKVTFEGVKFESVNGGAVLATRTNGANIELNDCVFENFSSPSTGNVGIQVFAKDVIMTFNGCTFKNMPIVTSSSYAGNVTLVFNNCTFSWVGANCPAMLQLENNVVAKVTFNDCKYTYDAPLTSTRVNAFVSTKTSSPVGTTITFNSFEMVGTAMEGKIWAIVSKGGVSSGNNVVVTATGTNTYTFNGEQVDFATYLFR